MPKGTRRTPVLIESLAVNLKLRRKALGLSQDGVAERVGLSLAYISLLERRARVAPLTTVEKLAHALEVEPHELLLPPSEEARRAAYQD